MPGAELMLRELNVGEAAHAAEAGYREKLPLRTNWIPNSLPINNLKWGKDFPLAVSLQRPLLRKLNILSATEEKY